MEKETEGEREIWGEMEKETEGEREIHGDNVK